MEISIFGNVDLRQENKGEEHHFSDQKSSNGTMSKSSVKTLANRMTFWTKSDEMVHFRKSAPTPMDSPFLAIASSASDGPEVVHFGTFGSKSDAISQAITVSNGHVPILSLLVQKVMHKQLRFSILFDMVQLGDFWSEKWSN